MSDPDIIVVNSRVPYISTTATNEGILAGPTGAPGPKGDKGDPGYTIHNGEGAPPSTLGRNGDFYIDTLNNRIHGPKANGTYPAGRDLRGPVGPTGPPGSTGPQGPVGSAAVTNFGGTGSSGLAAHSDHTHPAATTNTSSGGSNIRTSSIAYGGKTVPSGATIFMQMGMAKGTVGAGGVYLIGLPMSFPNGIIGVVATIGAQNGPTHVSISGQTHAGVVTAVIHNANGSPYTGTATITVNYFAYGW